MATTTPTVWLSPALANFADAAGANAFATNEQSHTRVIALRDGGFFLAWEDWSTVYSGFEPRDITARFFKFDGTRTGSEFNASLNYNDADQQAQALVQLSDGRLAVAYQTTDAAGFGDLENIDVTITSGATYIRHDDFREGVTPPFSNDTTPAIAALAGGAYALIWVNDSNGQTDLLSSIVTPSLDGSSSTRTAKTAIETSGESATLPDAVTLTNGNFVVAYQSSGGSGNIGFLIRSATNTAVASGTVSNLASAETAPQVARLTGGGFVVAWNDASGDGAGNGGIKAKVYKADGTLAVASVLTPNTTTTGLQSEAAVTGLADGGFLVAWTDDPSNTIKAQRYDGAGIKVGLEFTAASVTDVSQPDLALLADGRVVLSFTNVSSGNKNVYTTILDPRTTVTGTNSAETLTSRKDGAVVNGLAGADTLLGYNGADKLDGGSGADTMTGGNGNDTYVVSEALDQTNETSGAGGSGVDTVLSAVSRTLGNSLENLTLTGTAALSGNGNALNNVITGNTGNNALSGLDGNDTLAGGAGTDVLTGGAGRDHFFFNSALNSTTNRDTIKDFVVVDDTIRLENAIFTTLTTVGTLASKAFWASSTGLAHDADDRIVYNTASGVLAYDSNGNAAGGVTLFATLTPKLALTYADFAVI